MSEDVIRPRPVVDTTLPEELREDLLREAVAPESRHARDDGQAASRALRLREGGVQLLGVGFTLVLALLTAGWYLGMVIVSIGLIAYVGALAVRKEADPLVRAVGGAIGAGAFAAAPLWLFDLLPQDPPGGVPWLLFGLLVGLVTADTLTAQVPETPEEHHRDRVLLPDDISAADHGLLVAVQQTIDRVTDARVELGSSDTLDTARGLSVLREQEWRIASLLARQRELRRGYVRRWQQASSPRVREVLRPQREHLTAVEGHIRARVDQIVEYGRLVDESVLAHREWEQCQEALAATDDYADLRAEASLMSLPSPEVADLADTAEVARRVRDDSVARVHAATTGLAELPEH
ncbi:hypothetical protein [Nocardiopsis sp. L17-MgMaSL7]|uniref:hypothetical protein n=1 Tax=Nocardiopsis sp. L17-MgMaSL7 TaxID=1938893 RepID=UPI000D71AD96|nr:hypothetical protein [Nocardiopsis sp. L17-MgMaSL7]PWV52944.1 hypothetical protein BDW27_105290 [Nocardiopsis sp. L17-MgMaSL7]